MMSWRRVPIFVVLLCAVSPAQTQRSEFEQERLSEKIRIEAEAARLPSIRADSIEQVVRLGVEFDMLQATTSLTSEARDLQVISPGLRGIVCITLFGPKPKEIGEGSYFDLLQRDLTNPAAGQVYTRISAYAGRVNVIRDTEDDRGITSIQLLQDAPPRPDVPLMELPVRLYVHQMHGDEQIVRLKLEAPTFMLLRFRHVPELDRFVRPILRDLKQERALFAIPDTLGWIALGSTAPPDPVLLEKIMPAIARLDSEDFGQRAGAAKELRGLGPSAMIALVNLDRSRLTPQQQSEVAAIVEDSIPLPFDQLRALGKSPSFVLDMLYTSNPDLEKAALKRLGELTEKPATLRPTQSARERDAAISQLRDVLLAPTTQPVP